MRDLEGYSGSSELPLVYSVCHFPFPISNL